MVLIPSNEFLNYGVLPSCYLYNRNQTPLLSGKSPLKAILGKEPEYTRNSRFSIVVILVFGPITPINLMTNQFHASMLDTPWNMIRIYVLSQVEDGFIEVC